MKFGKQKYDWLELKTNKKKNGKTETIDRI